MTKTTVLAVPDMTCGHCEMSVKETLGGLPGVESVEADHVTGRVEVSYEQEKTDQEHFGRAVEEAGYTLTVS
jgi:copper chaperone